MNCQLVDLHTHSTCSDGALNPTDLLLRAAGAGVEHFAITDHDTIAGLEEGAQAAKANGVSFYSGVELSCVWQGVTIHILCYGFDVKCSHMAELCQHQEAMRLQRASIIAEKLERKFSMSGLLELAMFKSEGGAPGRPHFASAMVDSGLVDSTATAFKKYLGNGKVGDVKALWPNLEELMLQVGHPGWITSLAHPRKYDMTVSKLKRLLLDFTKSGGKGLEVSTSGQKQGEIGLLSDICRQFGLCASEGSDFHAPGMPWSEVGKHSGLPRNIPSVLSLLEPVN